MKTIKLFLEKWGLHTFLLPIFFFTHNYQQYYGLVSLPIAIKLGSLILLSITLLFVVFLAITKHVNKSLQLATLIGFIVLFFGVIKDFMQYSLHAYLLSKYSVLLPVIFVITVLLSWFVLKKNDFKKSNLFQNILLLIFLVVDVATLASFKHSSFLQKNLLVKKSSPQANRSFGGNSPDVYFLVFDSYPGTSFLREAMNYDNSVFNQQLESKGFYVVKKPKSNYNRTAFSIASTLNLDYLTTFRTNDYVSPKNYAEANLTIRESIVPQFFKKQGYDLYNLSVFDMGKIAPITRETFLTMAEQDVFLYNTLFQRIKNDLLWNLIVGKHASGFVQKLFVQTEKKFRKEQYRKKDFNSIVADSLLQIPFQKTGSPKFVYAHLYLPHPPFFYDENGNINDINYIMSQASLEDKNLFLSYLKYTNKKIIQITEKIKSVAGNKAVVIIQSDHGFRDFKGWQNHPEYFFTNYSAFYFPDKNYTTLYDTLSNVNTFPIILNKFFNTNIPLKKDSCIFLSD
jgi:Sulfatase